MAPSFPEAPPARAAVRYALVDLSNLMARCRHVTMGDGHDKAGMAVQILFRSLRKLHRERAVDHMVFAVDSGSWRTRAYPAYKARRKLDRLAEAPAQQEEAGVFRATLASLVAFLAERTRCTVLERRDIEGDDFLARWVQRHPDAEHVVVSSDTDAVQLLARNVTIYDGVAERWLATDGVRDAKGALRAFSVQPDGKLKVGKADPAFVAEREWWRKALFIKLVRGDPGDGVFAAYPGVRYKGSARREGIVEAWEDREQRGYHWANFFAQEWDKLVGTDEAGAPVTRRVRVLDEFRINTRLIDLTAQPEEVVRSMDEAIDAAVSRPASPNVGLHLLRFCGEQNLPALARESADHAAYLNAGYPGEILRARACAAWNPCAGGGGPAARSDSEGRLDARPPVQEQHDAGH